MYQEKQWGTAIALILAVLALCAGSTYLGYSFNQYQVQSDQQGYNFNLGIAEGEKIGHEKGFQEGYTAGLKEQPGFVLNDPTYAEMKSFLAADNTSSKAYNEDKYICTDFTTEVNNNAEEQGIHCATVYIIYPETGHSVVAFDTTDRGMIFIEPQYDKEIKLTIGSGYSASNGFIKPPDLDDTIVRYLIMW